MSHLSMLLLAAVFAASAEEIALETAGEAAQAWVDGGYSLGTMRGRRMASGETVEAGGAKIHVVRFEGGGFVAMGADDLVDPVIAFSPSGKNLSQDDRSPLRAILGADLALRAILGADLALRARAAERQEAGASAAKSGRTLLGAAAASSARTESQRRWDRLLGRGSGGAGLLRASTSSGPLDAVSDVRVEPLVKSRWGQENNSMYINYGEPCFNYYTPNNYPCGCVATAMAQVMRYHRHPASGAVVTKTCRVGEENQKSFTTKGGAYDYDSMPLVPEAAQDLPWYEGGATEAQREAMGRLTYDCCVMLQTWWREGGSSSGGAAAGIVMKTTNMFKYRNAVVNACKADLADANFRNRMIYPNLDAGMPVMLGLDDHQVIADGYGYSDGTLYTHLNMGWADECDVWYALPEVHPTVGDYSSSVVEAAIYNVFPTQAGEIVSGRVLASDGFPVEGARVSIRDKADTAVVSNVVTGVRGMFAFIVPSGRTYVVDAAWGEAQASAQFSTGTSASSSVTFGVGSCAVDASTSKACGNAWGCDLALPGVCTAAAPEFEPGGFVFHPSARVAISCATPGAEIRYTTDGSDPTAASALYEGPVEITSDTTLRARAFACGMNASPVASATYRRDSSVDAPDGDMYERPIEISGVGGKVVVSDNSMFGIEDGEPSHTLDADGYYVEYRSCWYRWKSPGTGTVSFSVKAFDMRCFPLPAAVAVYPDAECIPTSVDTRLAMEREPDMGDYATTVTLDVSEGAVYRIVGVLEYDEPGSFTLEWRAGPDFEVPTSYRGVYDGMGHGIDVSAVAASGASVMYARSEEGPYSREPVLFTNVTHGAESVWYVVEAEGHASVTNVGTVAISPKVLSAEMVSLVDSGLVYDGTGKFPSVSVADGEPSILTGADYAVAFLDNIDAGSGSASVVVSGKGNYTGSVSVPFSIAKADYDMSGAGWNYSGGFLFDGKVKSVELSGLPPGVAATYSGNSARRPGLYTAHAELSFDETNYNRPEVADLVWEILSGEDFVVGGRTLWAGEYFRATLAELGFDVPTDGTEYSVKAFGLPAGLKLMSNAAVKDKKGNVVVKAKSEWWIEGVPTAAVDFFTNPPYLVITVNGVATTEALPIEVFEQDVTELDDLALGQEVNEQFYLSGVADGWTVSGLPTGLKYTAKLLTEKLKSGKKTIVVTNALPYSVYGKTTKAGLFTITAKKKAGSYYETLKFRVLVRPKEVDATVFGEELTNVTTMAYVPVAWYLTGGGEGGGTGAPAMPVVSDVAKVAGLPGGVAFAAATTYRDKKKTQVRQYGQTIVGTPTKPGTYAVTFTKNVKNGKKTVAKTAQILWTVVENDARLELGFNTAGGVVESGSVGLDYRDLMAFCATDGASVTAGGLPAGIKLVRLGDGLGSEASAQPAMYGFAGFTTKAGTYLVTVSATLNGKTVTQRVALKVDALPDWAKGTFNGCVRGTANGEWGALKDVSGLATITVGATGKISGKFYEGGTNWTFSAASFNAARRDEAGAGHQEFCCTNVVAKYAYKATEVVKGKKKTVTRYAERELSFAVSPVPLATYAATAGNAPLRGFAKAAEVGGATVEAWQNLWGQAGYKALGNALFSTKSGKKTLAYRTWAGIAADGIGVDDALSAKVTTSGAVTATYRFFKGTFDKKGKPQYAAYTCATTLIALSPADAGADAFEAAAFVVFPPVPSAGFPGYSAELGYPFAEME